MDSKFISGTEYRLSDLFGGDTKIVIPDLQRDYCWGDKAYSPSKEEKPRELVTDFIKNLVEISEISKEEKKKRTTLGLIYGFEQPRNNIQICDGQQRLTTLFLLIGYINTKTDNKFRKYIISDEEMQDDFEPHLLYAIRESTLYFLSDLSRKVFIEKSTGFDKIKESDWYFNEYNEDASIQSMIAALKKIDNYFINTYKDTNFDFEEFGNFIIDNLFVLYYDMGNRSRGEETYVVINTTGEPLSATENIKPLLLGNSSLPENLVKKYSLQWEDREEWFWQNKGNDKIADKGMLEFFVWYWQIGLMQESSWIDNQKYPLNPRELFFNPPKRIKETGNDHEPSFSDDNYQKFKSLDNLHKYFQALTTLVDTILTDNRLKKLLLSIRRKKDQIDTLDSMPDIWTWLRLADLDVVLPLITYIAEYGTNGLYGFARRIRKNHYDGIWSKRGNEQSRRGKNYIDWRYLIQIINQTNVENIFTIDTKTLDFIRIPNVPLPEWYNDDEKAKQMLVNQCSDTFEIEKMEDNEYLQGDLTPLWNSMSNGDLDIESVKNRWKLLNRIIYSLDPQKANHDQQFSNWFRLYRLATGLISFSHIDYCCWDFEGVYYSEKPDNPWWIETKQIENIFDTEDSLEYMKKYISKRISPFIENPRDYKELVIGWMAIKTIQAEKEANLINHWSGRALSVFTDLNRNFITPSDKFHWGNVYCGYSYSYTVFPARDEINWRKRANIDSPIYSLPFIPDFYNRKEDVIDSETIQKGDDEIKEHIKALISMQ